MMLDFKRVLKSAKAPARGEHNRLSTLWGEALDPACVLPKHPRPTLQRSTFTMLNGLWDYAITPGETVLATLQSNTDFYDELRALLSQQTIPEQFDGRILVPFSPETTLSGMERTLQPNELLWYRREFEAPVFDENERLILHFEAIDWACALYVNGAFVATHIGGYVPFDIDISDFTASGASNELALCVFDPSDAGVQPRGKQALSPGGIWYTAQSGIWQSVWCETVPATHLTQLALMGDMRGNLQLEAAFTGEAQTLELSIADASGTEALHEQFPLQPGSTHTTLMTHVANPHLWSPEDPYLYQTYLTLTGANGSCDTVSSYCAFRTVEVKADENAVPRFFLNGNPYFLKGALDQGYWSDSLMTAPSDDALIFDIETCKAAGFNMLRKHIKIESARWYYHCDRIGMLVWQDAVQGGGAYSAWYTSRWPTLVRATWDKIRDTTPAGQRKLSGADARYQNEWTDTCAQMVSHLKGHPSVATWVLFNEGWGQFDAARAAEMVRRLDGSRPIDATSGWFDQNCGDFHSVHDYFRPLAVYLRYKGEAAGRAYVLSEFGGLTYACEGHTFANATYGYGDYENVDEWRAAVHEKLAQAQDLQEQGCAGYVYTQVSDVEDELNGLLTFDRCINKLQSNEPNGTQV